MRLLIYLFFCFSPLLTRCQGKNKSKPGSKSGTARIIFTNQVNGHPVVLNDSSYNNPWGETYSLSKLKYYISNISINTAGKKFTVNKNCYLIDQADSNSFVYSFAVPENEYESISFLIGVDSARNISGAQTGALDPLNDMFWTWNSGYIMEKLEGNSPQSKIVNNKIEYHIGGFSGENNSLRYVTLSWPAGNLLKITKGRTSNIRITADINRIWQGSTALKISDNPVCATPGSLAKMIADNFCNAFKVAGIYNSEQLTRQKN